MTKHLSPEEFVDALESTSTMPAAHLAECAECRDELASLEATLTGARHLEASEPSPLFWDHFSARVRQATEDQPIGTGWTWGCWFWKPGVALLAIAGALVIGLSVRPPVPSAGSIPDAVQRGTEVASAAVPEFEDDGSWSLVTALASELDWNELSQAAEPADGTVDAMIDELTAEQREALARLLQKEMGAL